MKHLYLTLLFCSLLAGVTAQESQQPRRFDGGIIIGFNLSQIDGDNSSNYTHFGMHGAVQTSFTLGKNLESPWRMIVELGVTEKGANKSQTNVKTHLLYLELPIMASYSFLDNNLRLGAGLAPAILLKAKVMDSKMEDPEAAKAYRRMDWLPLCFDVSYFIAGHFGINFRYNISMLSIMDHPSKGTYRISRKNKGAFNNFISLNFEYRF